MNRSAFLRACALSSLVALAACGGGGGSSGGSTPTTPTAPSYGGSKTPGSVTMTITHKVTLTTTKGVINIGLDATNAPLSANNFLAYVNNKALVNTVFHRVVPGFVIQGGGYTVNGSGAATAITTLPAIGLESRNGLSNTAGTLGMARTSVPDSATSQFYINLVNNSAALDFPASDNAGYAVFGKVMDDASLAVVAAIAASPTGVRGGMSDWPITDVTVTAVAIVP